MDIRRITARLQAKEALRLRPYRDSEGFPTVGYGHLIRAGESYAGGITADRAMSLLLSDIATAVKLCKAMFPRWYFWEDCQQEAVCELMFILGPSKLRLWQHMLAAIHSDRWTDAACELLTATDCEPSHFWIQVGDRAVEIADMMDGGPDE